MPNDEVIMEQKRMPNCKNIGDPSPTKIHTLSDGSVLEEKINPMPCHKKMVDPNGHVSQVSLATGYTIRGLGSHNPYGVAKLAEKIKKGWLPYDQCPVAMGYITAAKGEPALKPCKGRDGDGQFSREECCPHIEEAIKVRRAKYTKKQNQFKRQMASNTERMLEQLERQTEKMAKAAVERDPKKAIR
jgi:hypothetical protein